jgi:3-oxoacyl-[acyl-carrier protein] reductase
MIALVTGGGNPRGIGAACVRALAGRGATVAYTVQRDEEPPTDLSGTPFTTDLSEADAPEHLLDAVTERLGHPTVLVNNAAYSARDGFAALDAATIDAHYAVNVRAPMLLSVLLARAGRPGRIVNLVSGQFLGGMRGELAYTASKGALEAFTLQLAHEVAELGITVNAVNPGPNDTGWIDDALRAELLPRFPMGRIGRPEDAAAVVVWLCSEEAGWVTGQVIHAEGGFLRR